MYMAPGYAKHDVIVMETSKAKLGADRPSTLSSLAVVVCFLHAILDVQLDMGIQLNMEFELATEFELDRMLNMHCSAGHGYVLKLTLEARSSWLDIQGSVPA
jgi:hypothetical protein